MRSKKQISKYYFDHPEIWEQLRLHSIDKEILFLDNFFSKHKVKTVLDIGCGSGIHCQKLTKLGYKTLGIDLNKKMIKYATKHYPESEYSIGDMQNLGQLKLSHTFDAIICLCTTFSYNLGNPEVLGVLNEFNKVLNKNGLLIIEVFNPICFLEKKKFDGSFFLEDKSIYNSLGFDVRIIHSVDEKEQIIIEKKDIFDLISGELLKTDNTKFRMFFPKEIDCFLQISGYKVRQQFGRYDLEYKKLDNTRLISVAQKIS